MKVEFQTSPGSSNMNLSPFPMPLSIKISMVTHYMPPHLGGIELMAESLFRQYREAGCEVRWMASRVPPQARGTENGRIRIGCLNWLESHLGVPWPIWGPTALPTLLQMVKWADIVHIHDCLYCGSALAMILARRLKKPVLLSQHIGTVEYSSLFLNILARLAYQTLGRAVLNAATCVVFCTPSAEEFGRRLLRSPETSSSIALGVDTRRFHPPNPEERCQAHLRLGLPEAGQVVLFVGRLLEKKGSLVFQEVVNCISGPHFVMVGDGPLRPVPRDNLTWLPVVPPDQMYQVYQTADAFVLPSLSEGFPLAVLEAMASGVPVIVSRHLAFATMLEKEGAGCTAERTPRAFSAALERVLGEPELAASLARRARMLVEKNWSSRGMTMKYLGLIQHLTGKD